MHLAQREVEDNGLFHPLVDGPLASCCGGRLGHAQVALVQLLDGVLDGGFGIGLVEQGAVGPGAFDGLLGGKAVEQGIRGSHCVKGLIKLSC